MISKDQIFNIQNRSEFEETALAVFNFQAENNPVYAEFIGYLGVDPKQIKSIEQIPFLPIRFFKNRRVITGNREVEKTFTSSGTSGMERSRHFVTNLDFYRESLNHSFKYFYGDFSDYTIFGLLPSYLERSGSSLIDMVGYWIEQSGRGGFYLYNHDELHSDLIKNEEEGRKAILIGVSFALIDFVENYKMNLKNTIVMETGGMKGRKKEITRDELHSILKTGFGLDQIHSEYGMTELLSQAYSTGGTGFVTPPWMKVLIRDTEDPLSYSSVGRTGGINVIDLANLNSCSFIATDDLGKSNLDGSFEVLGRFDHSDVRGCNLMVSDL
ncbi:MAG: acyl transferase [Moheibacter sp.]